MNLPKEIADKYNYLKQQTFENLGLVYQPGVLTYVPPPPPNSLPHATVNSQYDANSLYSQTNYQSTGGVKSLRSNSSSDQQYAQIEELMKSFIEHLANMTQVFVLEEDTSFIQESLSKKFLEPLVNKDYFYSQLPKDFLGRVDSMKNDFDIQVRRLVEHFASQKEESDRQTERKVEMLKQEVKKWRQEAEKAKVEGGKRAEEESQVEVRRVQEENQKYIDKLKMMYENEIYEIRNKSTNLDAYRDKLFNEIHNRVLAFVQEKNPAYLTTYCQDLGLPASQIDPIDLLFYICQRLHTDNNWLVDKLAETQQKVHDTTQLNNNDDDTRILLDSLLNTQLFSDIVLQAQQSFSVLEDFENSHKQFRDDTSYSHSQGKENSLPFKRNTNSNYNSTNNLRESMQSLKGNQGIISNTQMGKSSSGNNLNMKHQEINRMAAAVGDQQTSNTQRHRFIGEDRESLEEQNFRDQMIYS